MRLFFGEMNENRKRWVFKAFSRVDPKKRGYGPINEIKKFYNASQGPKVVKGEKLHFLFVSFLSGCGEYNIVLPNVLIKLSANVSGRSAELYFLLFQRSVIELYKRIL